MSADHPTIHERLIAIIGDLPAIAKDRVNRQQGFMFRGIDDVLDALGPLLAKHGVYYTPRVLERRDSERTTAKGNSLYVVLLHVEFTFHGAGGDSVVASTWGEGSDSGDKATSKAHTMAQKSCLMEVLNVRTQDTPDPDAETPEESSGRPAAKPARDDRMARIRSLMDSLDLTAETVKGHIESVAPGKKLAELTDAEYEQVLDVICGPNPLDEPPQDVALDPPSAAQLKKLWAVANKAWTSDESDEKLHELLRAETGKSSLKDLTATEASKLIDAVSRAVVPS